MMVGCSQAGTEFSLELASLMNPRSGKAYIRLLVPCRQHSKVPQMPGQHRKGWRV
jgi:hypothetical protein